MEPSRGAIRLHRKPVPLKPLYIQRFLPFTELGKSYIIDSESITYDAS